jgi:nickel/cobalt exporter
MQSFAAVAIVGIAAVMLGATAKLMGDTLRVIEIVSYSLIALLGARLMWIKGRGFLKAVRALRQGEQAVAAVEPHAHLHCRRDHDEHGHDHAHDVSSAEHNHHGHCHDHHPHHEEEPDVLPWGHANGPEPDELAGQGGWRRGFSAVVSVGLRPCSGAIIVLVFALAQGMFWAGVASTFVMGIGTAITVGIIATLAVGAKAVAKRFARQRTGYGSVLVRGAEVAAATLVLAFSILFLTGYMVSERMVGF